MSNSVKHHINTLLLHEKLIEIKSSASRVSQTESSANVLFINLPEGWVVIDSLWWNTEKLGLRSERNMWVRDDPLFFFTDFHQSQFFNFVVLSIENANSGSSTIDGKSGTNKVSSGFAFEVSGLPDTEDRSNREVAVDDRASIDWIKSNEVGTIFVDWVELYKMLINSNLLLTCGFSSEAAPKTTPEAVKCLKIISSAARSISDWSLPKAFLDATRWTKKHKKC